MYQLLFNQIHFNHRANQKLLTFLKQLDEALLIRQAPGTGSVNLILKHILKAQEFWTAFVYKEDLSGFSWAVDNENPAQALRDLENQNETMKNRLLQWSEAELEEVLCLKQAWAQSAFQRQEYILHLIHHSNYHRGQIPIILRSLAYTGIIPNTDYHFFLLEQ